MDLIHYCIEWCKIKRKNKVNAKLIEFTQLPHGFLNMIKTNLTETKYALDSCIEALKELANIK